MQTVTNEPSADRTALALTDGAPPGPALSLERLAAAIGAHATARTVFGEPVHGEGVIVIPVARAAWGFGGGIGEGTPERIASDAAGTDGDGHPRRPAGRGWGSGGGGGVGVTPIGYVVLRRGDAEFRPVVPRSRLLAAAAAAGALVGAWAACRLTSLTTRRLTATV